MRVMTVLIIIVLILGLGGLFAWYFAKPFVEDHWHRIASDAKATKGTITIAMDNWVGYYPLCSEEMERRMRSEGYLLKCEDDNADYPARMKRLKDGSVNFAVATVDSYLRNAADLHFPGTIIAPIDESSGGDAMVARKDKVSNLDALKRAEFLIAFTPASPSEHILLTAGNHFDIPYLRTKGAWRIEAEGSTDALKKFQKKEVDVAVLWQPDVARALEEDGVIKILSTADMSKVIVDILLVNRDYSQKHPEIVALLLSHYFQTLKHYRDNESALVGEIAKARSVSKAQAEEMIRGVKWITLYESVYEWFGTETQGGLPVEWMVDTIQSTVKILVASGIFPRNPIPGEDPYRLLYSEPLASLYKNEGAAGLVEASAASAAANVFAGDPLTKDFAPLTIAQWEKELRAVGTLKIEPITFQSGTAVLPLGGREELDRAAENLKHYPNFRVLITGHTSLSGDRAANKKLSQERADAVRQHLMVTFGIDEDRLLALGWGSEKPLPRLPEESPTARNFRLPRVELTLMGELH